VYDAVEPPGGNRGHAVRLRHLIGGVVDGDVITPPFRHRPFDQPPALLLLPDLAWDGHSRAALVYLRDTRAALKVAADEASSCAVQQILPERGTPTRWPYRTRSLCTSRW
jgi:hypothetical protein